jgi:hypothetical protein
MQTSITYVVNKFYFCFDNIKRNRDSIIGIETGYGLDHRGVEVQVTVRSRIFSSPRPTDWYWGPPGVKRTRRRWVDNVKMDLREIGWGGMDWIDVAQDRD